MMSWLPLVQLGDLPLTLPAGAAIAAWLLAWRAWRTAAGWCLLFALGLGLVGVAKIAFMGWGLGIEQLDYKAPSGHAAGVAAVFPMLFYLLLHDAGPRLRRAGLAAGLALGVLVAALLVMMREHSAAEAAAGLVVGALVSLGSVHWGGALPPPRPLAGLVAFALAFATGAALMQSAHVGYWMILAARQVSGNDKLFPLSFE